MPNARASRPPRDQARDGARVGAGEAVELLDEPVGGVGHDLVQALGAFGLCGGLAVHRRHVHPGGLGEFLHRVHEGEAALVGHPLDRVAVG
jgi:hypothetical protein